MSDQVGDGAIDPSADREGARIETAREKDTLMYPVEKIIGRMEDWESKRDLSSRTSPTQAIIEAVAAAEDVSPEEVVPPTYEPLHDVVDPQALDALFAPKRNGTPRVGGRVSFEFCGYEVTVHEDGAVTLG